MKYKELPDITLKMLVQAGTIKSGSNVFAECDNTIVGVVDDEGAITLIIENESKTFSYPSGAARAITKTSVNGWKFWRVFENNLYNELRYYKELYKQLKEK